MTPAASARPATTWPSALPDHLSASALSLADKCLEAYRQRYVLKKYERMGAALILGRGVDDALTHGLTTVLSGQPLPPATEVDDAFMESVSNTIDQAGGEAEVAFGDANRTSVETTGRALVRAYWERVAPRVRPVAVQKDFSYTSPRLPIPITGRIDLIDEVEGVVEWKTTAARTREPKTDWQLQGRTYSAAMKLPVAWHVGVKAKAAYFLTREDEPGLVMPAITDTRLYDKLVGRRMQLIHAAWELWGPDEPWPDAIAHQWACKTCAYKRDGSCVWWAGDAS